MSRSAVISRLAKARRMSRRQPAPVVRMVRGGRNGLGVPPQSAVGANESIPGCRSGWLKPPPQPRKSELTLLRVARPPGGYQVLEIPTRASVGVRNDVIDGRSALDVQGVGITRPPVGMVGHRGRQTRDTARSTGTGIVSQPQYRHRNPSRARTDTTTPLVSAGRGLGAASSTRSRSAAELAASIRPSATHVVASHRASRKRSDGGSGSGTRSVSQL
jgi:hypothetical protein